MEKLDSKYKLISRMFISVPSFLSICCFPCLYSCVERGPYVNCLSQEHNTVTPASASPELLPRLIAFDLNSLSKILFTGHIPRAVILFGPMVDVLYEKLCEEVPYKFVQCKPGITAFLSLRRKCTRRRSNNPLRVFRPREN